MPCTDALYAVLCAADYNLRGLLRAIARKVQGSFCANLVADHVGRVGRLEP